MELFRSFRNVLIKLINRYGFRDQFFLHVVVVVVYIRIRLVQLRYLIKHW